MSPLQLIDMGKLTDFLARTKQLSQSADDREFRFRELDEMGGGFWVFEEETDDEILGGILQVSEGRVFAISPDVERLVSAAFQKAV